MQVPAHIFRAYDIRGIIHQDLTEDIAYHLGRAIGSTIKARNLDTQTVSIGRDCRPSGEWLSRALIRGFLESGIHVIDVGVVPTPLQYYSIHHLKTQGGVQITGSHNPPEYNGFKISIGTQTLFEHEIQELKRRIEEENYTAGQGTYQSIDITESYLQTITDNIRSSTSTRKLKVVVDAGNGTAGPLGPVLYRALGVQVYPLYCEMDATFPNHHPDPTVEENLLDLQRMVLEQDADLGIAFDGDGDRIGVVDEHGQIIWGDQLLMILSRALLKEQPGATIIGEVKCTQNLFDDIKKQGGQPIMWKAGHSLIKAKMKETEASLAGEMSGHIFYKHRYLGFDDALYAGARLIEILAHTNTPISQLLKDVPITYSTPEIRINCDDIQKFPLMERIKQYFKSQYQTIDVDGVRVIFETGWGLIRASNTQPILVVRAEAKTKEALHLIEQILKETIEAHRQTL